MTSKKTHDSDSGVTASKEDIDGITLLLKNMEVKFETMAELQSQLHQFNRQHHENLKKVMLSLNQMTQLLKGNLPPNSLLIIEPLESMTTTSNKSDNKTTNSSSSKLKNTTTKEKEGEKEKDKEKEKEREKSQTFHERVLKAYDENNICSLDILKLFRSLDNDTWGELKDSSAFILSKVAVKWLTGMNPKNQVDKVSKSLSFLWACKQDFKKMLCKQESHNDIQQILAGLERLDEEGKLNNWMESNSLPLNAEELCELKLFLERCLVV